MSGGIAAQAPRLRVSTDATGETTREASSEVAQMRPATGSGANLSAMAAVPKTSVEIEADLMERAKRAARERGVAVPELVREALEHELGPDRSSEQPPVTCIGMFESSSGDLSTRASRDEYEPPPFR